MGKMIALALALLLLVGLCACTRQMPAAPASAEQTAVLTAPPEGMAKYFGRDITIACDAPEDGLFAQGVIKEAARAGIPLRFVRSAQEAEGCDALIHVRESEMAADALKLPYVTLNSDGMTDEKAAGNIVYSIENETEAALETMFNYPSHEAPIRILGLFNNSEGEAARLYMKMEREGKLQSKGVFADSDGKLAGAWLEETLSGIGVGVLDTVFAESPELAMSGFAALQSAARNDAVEICAAGLSRVQIEAMLEDHFLMGSAVGLDEYNAGKLALRMCAGILANEQTEKTVTIQPFALCSYAVRELQKAGVEAPCEILETLNEQMNNICDFDFLHELAEYYKA